MLRRFFAASFALLMLASAMPLAMAAEPTAPTSLPDSRTRHVYGEFDLTQPTLTHLDLTAQLFVYRHEVDGDVYDADDISQAYSSTNKYAGKPSGDAFVVRIEAAVAAAVTNMLKESFPDATISEVRATVDRTSFVPPSGNSLEPGIRVALTAQIDRTREAVGLGTLTDDAVGAAFSAGAVVGQDLALSVDSGYHIVFSVHSPTTPAGIRFAPGTGVVEGGTTFSSELDNTAGTATPISVTIALHNPSVVPTTAERIDTNIDVTLGDAAGDAETLPIIIEIKADIGAFAVATRMPGALPANVQLAFVNADGLRGLRQAGVVTDEQLANANDALLGEMRTSLARAFGEGVTVTGGLSTADLDARPSTPYAAEPPVGFAASAQASYAVPNANAADIDLALRIGGTATLDLNLFAVDGRATTFSVHPPSAGEFTAAEGGTVTADGRTATITMAPTAPDQTMRVSLRGRDVPDFNTQKASIAVTVDLEDLDVSIGQAAGGDFGNLLMAIQVRASLGVIEVPASFSGKLPEGLELSHLSSDAIRLLVDRGRVTEADLAELETTMLNEVADKLGGALGGTIPVKGGLDRQTLARTLVQNPISADTPIVFEGNARVSKPLAGGPIQPQAAIALYQQALPLTLPRIQGFDTVYTIILPRGLAVADLTGSGGDFTQGEAADGREQFTVTPTSDSASVTVAMAVTPTFVLAKFWPIVLGLVVLLVLIVGTPIALVVRGRAKKKNAKK